jgi:hypothetical protein
MWRWKNENYLLCYFAFTGKFSFSSNCSSSILRLLIFYILSSIQQYANVHMISLNLVSKNKNISTRTDDDSTNEKSTFWTPITKLNISLINSNESLFYFNKFFIALICLFALFSQTFLFMCVHSKKIYYRRFCVFIHFFIFLVIQSLYMCVSLLFFYWTYINGIIDSVL